MLPFAPGLTQPMKRLTCLLLMLTLFSLSSPTQAAPSLLQFNNGGHVLGFKAHEWYVTNATYLLTTQFVGSNDVAMVTADSSATPGVLPTLSKVTYPDLWDGVTVVYEAQANALVKSTYLLAAGADASKIKLAYNMPFSLQRDGSLCFAFETGRLCESAPIAWQDLNGQRHAVEVAFVRVADHVTLRLGEYDPTLPLTIDPSLTWHTFLGGAGVDISNSVAVDGNGNVYVVGESTATWGTPLNAFSGNQDAFIVKLNSSGVRQWHTFLGGAGDDINLSVTVDGNGNLYVTGYSSATWGTPLNGFGGGVNDIFVAKLSSSGALTWHTFLGGAGEDAGYGIAVDGSGNLYVSGYSTVTWGTPLNAFNGNQDAVVAKMNSSGALQWHTFLGGAGNDGCFGMTMDSSGNLYLTGDSTATWGTPINSYNTGDDTFVAKVNNSGALQWNTFLGGTGADVGYSMAVNNTNGNLYVTGYSSATWGTPISAFSGGTSDAFITKLNSNGALQWHTFLGGTAGDVGYGVVADSSDNVYVAGYSQATWGTPLNLYGGGIADAFVAKMNNSGVRQWHTFLGGLGDDVSYGMRMDHSGNVYVTGYSDAPWGTPVNGYSAGVDAFVVKYFDVLPQTAVGGVAQVLSVPTSSQGLNYLAGMAGLVMLLGAGWLGRRGYNE